MFQNKSVFGKQNETNIQHQDLSQASDLKIENIPIHTMAKDIQEIEHPTAKINVSEESPARIVANQNLTEKQKSSPFFNPAAPVATAQPQQTSARSAVNPIPDQKIEQIQKEKFTQTKIDNPLNKGRLITIAITIFIILIVGAGVYYFLATRQKGEEQIVISPEPAPEPTPEPAPEPTPTPTPEPKNDFTADKPNYLSIDFENSDTAAVKTAITGYVQKVQDSKITTPVEFLLVDAKNNPITFENFAKKFGLALSAKVVADLGSDFSLYIYSDQSDMRLGLSIASKNDTKLKTDLLNEEKALTEEIKPLFIPIDYKIEAKTFGASSYNGANIRYNNISGAANLSVDYAIVNKQLLIGTTKMTLRSIIDKISATQASPATENPVPVPTN